MVELFEDVRGDGGGPVETMRDVERIGLRVYITDPDTIAPFVPGTIPPGMEGISHRFEINITDEAKLHGWYSAQTCQPPTLMVVLHQVNGNVDADEPWESPPPRGEPPWFPVDHEQAAPESEEELDPPVSDSEVKKSRKRRTRILKLNRTFEERLGKSRRRLHREFDYRDVLKRHHKVKFPGAIHSRDDDWAADERQVFDPAASAERRAARVGGPPIGKSKGKGKAAEKGKGKAVEKGRERGVKRKAASEPE
ncbi:hypothetical protein Q9L58_010694 [Maublancomyces gigas]|uniref:Uncharacterized protein n=1 Tax=Discina gigas TaxID=1032678 RepID=A0ABR3G3U5_9PEZI